MDGDIIVLTDERPYGDGTLFDVNFEAPGYTAADLGSIRAPALDRRSGTDDVNESRMRVAQFWHVVSQVARGIALGKASARVRVATPLVGLED